MPARSSKAARCARCWRGRAIPTRWACATPSPTCCRDALELVPIGGSPPDLREPLVGLPLRAALPVRPAAPAASTPRDRAATAPTSRPAAATARPTPFEQPHWIPGHGSARRASRCREAFPGDALAGRDRPRRASGRARARRRRASTSGDGDAVAIVGESGCGKTTLGPPDAEAGRADRRRDHLRRRADGRAGRRAAARLPPPGAARVPEPVRRAQPALHHLPRRRRAADQRRHRQGRARRPRRLGASAASISPTSTAISTAIRTS